MSVCSSLSKIGREEEDGEDSEEEKSILIIDKKNYK